jgi:hypothetical protein
MTIEAARHPDHTARNLIKGWLFTINLFYILFSLVALATFLLGPQSGRLSTLVCKPDPWGKVVCTVKIYGVHKIYRKDFYADDYMYTLRSSNFGTSDHSRAVLADLSLPWSDALNPSSSDEIVCAVSIRIQSQLVDFVPPYQRGSVCSLAEEQVKAAFAGDRSAIDVRINGYNPQIPWRIKLLVIASLLFLVQCALRLIGWRRAKNAAVVPEGLTDPSAPSPANLLTGGESQPTEQAAHPVGLSRKRFILFWWAAGVVIIVFLVISGWLNSMVSTGFWVSGCFLNIHDYQKLYMQYPFTNLISLLPYIISITLWMVLQWQVLRTELPVSRWWIAAPVLAGIPLLIWMPPALSCNDIADLALPSIFPASNSQAATVLSVVFYFLIFGFIQWLVLRGKVKISIGWIVIPFLSVGIEAGLSVLLIFLGLAFISLVRPDNIRWPALIGWALIMLVLATIFNLAPGVYLHRAIHKKQTSPAQSPPD